MATLIEAVSTHSIRLAVTRWSALGIRNSATAVRIEP
jgi:hypothetical protein